MRFLNERHSVLPVRVMRQRRAQMKQGWNIRHLGMYTFLRGGAWCCTMSPPILEPPRLFPAARDHAREAAPTSPHRFSDKRDPCPTPCLDKKSSTFWPFHKVNCASPSQLWCVHTGRRDSLNLTNRRGAGQGMNPLNHVSLLPPLDFHNGGFPALDNASRAPRRFWQVC